MIKKDFLKEALRFAERIAAEPYSHRIVSNLKVKDAKDAEKLAEGKVYADDLHESVRESFHNATVKDNQGYCFSCPVQGENEIARNDVPHCEYMYATEKFICCGHIKCTAGTVIQEQQLSRHRCASRL